MVVPSVSALCAMVSGVLITGTAGPQVPPVRVAL